MSRQASSTQRAANKVFSNDGNPAVLIRRLVHCKMLFALSECGMGGLATSKQLEVDLESDGAEAVLAAPCTTVHSKSTWQHHNPESPRALEVFD
jgi:hypothetical protein